MQTRVELACFAMLCVLLAAVIVQGAEHCHKDGGCEVENKKAEEPLRLIMVGKTGSGKSATGNTILGEKKFKVARMSKSVTQKAQLERTVIDGRTVEVVDMPSLFDNRVSHQEMTVDLVRTVGSTWPGTDLFLYVLEARDLTAIDFLPYRRMKTLLGSVHEHMIVVVTHLDQLEDEGESEESFKAKYADELKTLMNDCEQRLVFFDNRSKDRKQVDRLFEIIGKMHAKFYRFETSPITKAFREGMKRLLTDIDAEEESYFRDVEFTFSDEEIPPNKIVSFFWSVTSWVLDKYNRSMRS